MRVLNTDIRATTDEQGIAELRFTENINELILVSLENEEYIESTQTCFARQYQDRNNPYTILTQLANFAITNLTMYQEQTQDNTTKQIPIYIAQPYTSNTQAHTKPQILKTLFAYKPISKPYKVARCLLYNGAIMSKTEMRI